jgi:hypothetical protein
MDPKDSKMEKRRVFGEEGREKLEKWWLARRRLGV